MTSSGVVPSGPAGPVPHRALARYARANQDDDLIRKHSGLIDRVARALAQKTGAWDHLDDLWNAGALGLVDAARRYDASVETRFETFAAHRVRGAMLDELRRLDHLPRRLRERVSGVEKARWQLQTSLGREPSSQDLASHLGMALQEVDELRGVMEPAISVDEPEDLQALEPDAFERTSRAEVLARVSGAISQLPERLRIVLGLRYDEGLTTKEIGEILDVSEARVSQLHTEAISLIRRNLEEPPASSGTG